MQDAEFTVLALVPTLATQLSEQLDVEARSRQLADIAKRERDEKTRAAAAAAAAKHEADERAKAEEEAQHSQSVQLQEGAADPSSEENAATAVTDQVDGDAAPSSVSGSSPSPAPAPEPAKISSALSPPSLNPAAPAFQPRFAPATSPSPPNPVEAAPTATPSAPAPEDFPSLPNGHAVAEKPDEAGSPSLNGPGVDESVHDAESLANVGKSWAEIVKENAPSAENGADDLPAGGEKKDVEQVGNDNSEPRMANQEVNGKAGTESDEAAQSLQVEETLPKKTKAELWHEIKTLCTSLLGGSSRRT